MQQQMQRQRGGNCRVGDGRGPSQQQHRQWQQDDVEAAAEVAATDAEVEAATTEVAATDAGIN